MKAYGTFCCFFEKLSFCLKLSTSVPILKYCNTFFLTFQNFDVIAFSYVSLLWCYHKHLKESTVFWRESAWFSSGRHILIVSYEEQQWWALIHFLFWTVYMCGESPVLPNVPTDRVPEVPASLLSECAACNRWVRVHAVGVLNAELSWISWFSSWISVKIWALRGSKLALILWSIKPDETLVLVLLFLLALRVAHA